MPTEAELEAWFPYLFALNFLWIVGLFAFGAFRRIQSGQPLIPRKPAAAAFYESGASGRNLRNIISRLGGASRCLVVTVLDGRLSTDTTLPFNIFPIGRLYGIHIDIRLAEITRIERRRTLMMGDTVRVQWSCDEGFEFRVRDPDALIRALDPSGRIRARSAKLS